MIRHLRGQGRLLLDLPPGTRRVLDLGCGIGRMLGGLAGADVYAVGLDLRVDALQQARSDVPGAAFVCARGEELPFPDQCFDVVYSKVALPYMNIPAALAEMARVTRPGGEIWLMLHRPGFVWHELLGSLRRGNLQDALYRIYVLANGCMFHLSGSNFSLGRRCESFQTEAVMRRLLSGHGFDLITVTERLPFVMTATRRGMIVTSRLERGKSAAA